MKHSVKVFKTFDGRELRFKKVWANNFKMKSGVITKKKCAECGQFKDISEYPSSGKSLYSYCEECRRPLWVRSKYGETRGHGFNGAERVMDRAVNIGGQKHILCNLCKTHVVATEFSVGQGARCRDCRRKYGKWYFLLLRAKKMFGERSIEYRAIKLEKSTGDFLGIAKTHGFLNIKREYGKIPSSHYWRGKNNSFKTEDFS